MMISSLVIFLLGTLVVCQVDGRLRRFKRQYGTDDYDPVTGVQIGECTFYGDLTTDCSGRLTCRPSDLEDRPTAATMDRVCPKESGLKSGRWERDQVVPSNMIPRDAGSGRICKCQFFANRGTGNFKCTGVQGDTWKGTYTGSLNTAFRLGLTPSYGTGVGGARTDSNYDRYGSGSGRQTADDDTYGRGSYGRDRPGSTGRDDYSGGRYSTSLGAGERDPYYRANDRDNDAINTRYQSSYGSTGRDRDTESSLPRSTTSEVIMCTYMNDGKGTCRDCTERIDRKETSSEIRTTKHYTCSGPETRTTWTEDNGIMPRGTRPDPYVYTKKLAATCIFHKDTKRFDCHASSTDGNCSGSGSNGYGTSGSRYGSDTTTPQRCLGGEKWSGTYRGSVY